MSGVTNGMDQSKGIENDYSLIFRVFREGLSKKVTFEQRAGEVKSMLISGRKAFQVKGRKHEKSLKQEFAWQVQETTWSQ